MVVIAFLSSSVLSGCQRMTKDSLLPLFQAGQGGTIRLLASDASITCQGTVHCEITRIDKIPIIDPSSHQPYDIGMVEQNDVETQTALDEEMPLIITPQTASSIQGLNIYYVRMLPIQHEVHVNFYPEDNVTYVERFAFIHEFADTGSYRLLAYRQPKVTVEGGSLLETASPDPLCVDLLHDNEVIRRFCKPMDKSWQNEFIEKRLIADAADASSAMAEAEAN